MRYTIEVEIKSLVPRKRLDPNTNDKHQDPWNTAEIASWGLRFCTAVWRIDPRRMMPKLSKMMSIFLKVILDSRPIWCRDDSNRGTAIRFACDLVSCPKINRLCP